MKKNFSTILTRAIALGLLFTPTLALAHPGHSSGLTAGAVHPFSGLDHFAAMLAVGLWASQLGGRSRILVPLTFVAAMIVGGILGVSGMVIAGVEQGIAASVIVLGLLVTVARRLPPTAAMALVAGFALFHGTAHGSEMPIGANSAAYCLGFVFSTLVLQTMGLGLGAIAVQANRPQWIRLGGAAVVLVPVLIGTA
jgi:urease accessory protein